MLYDESSSGTNENILTKRLEKSTISKETLIRNKNNKRKEKETFSFILFSNKNSSSI